MVGGGLRGAEPWNNQRQFPLITMACKRMISDGNHACLCGRSCFGMLGIVGNHD